MIDERDDPWAASPYDDQPGYERGWRELGLATVLLCLVTVVFALPITLALTNPHSAPDWHHSIAESDGAQRDLGNDLATLEWEILKSRWDGPPIR